MKAKRAIQAAIDCVTVFRASGYPLKNVVNEIAKKRKANSGERAALRDIAFAWSREINVINEFLKRNSPFSSGLSTNRIDLLAIEMLASKRFGYALNKHAAALTADFDRWESGLGDQRYLIAVGPLFRKELERDRDDQAVDIAKGLFARPAKYLAFDRNFLDAEMLAKTLSDLGIAHFFHAVVRDAIGTYQRIDLEMLPRQIRDHVWLMDAASQLIARLIQPKSDEKVLDLCAGEGNKARYITMNRCRYTAVDINGSRLKIAERRLSHSDIRFVQADGRDPSKFSDDYDWILVDAPCTGSGILRRNPDLIHRFSVEDLYKYIELQKDLLKSAAKLLKPGGKLIYSTCSIFAAENEQQIKKILHENDRLYLLPIADFLNEGICFPNEDINKHCFTLFPHIYNCDGFFFAGLSKV